MALDARGRIEIRDALVAAFQEFGNDSFSDFLARSLNKDYSDYRITGAIYKENVLAVVKTADTESWLIDLLRAAQTARPNDQELARLTQRLQPHATGLALDHFEACCLSGQHIMVNRRPLRKALRDLDTDQGKRILVVQDAKLSGGTGGSRTKTGKSHTVHLVAYLKRTRGKFDLAWIDLEPVANALRPGEVIQPVDLARKMIALMSYDPAALLPQEPWDSQWSRWVLDFCDRFESRIQQDDRRWWIVIDAFNIVPLPQPTVDLVKELAKRINVSLDRVRLVLLGYADIFPPEVLPTVQTEPVKRLVSQEEVIEFFQRVCLERQITPTTDDIAQLVVESLEGLDPEKVEFLQTLGPRLSERMVRLVTGAGGGGDNGR